LVIEAVPGLVKDAEEGLAEVAGLVPRGDPAIPRPDPRAERVRRGVEAAGVEVEADRRRHGLAEDPLAVERIAGGTAKPREIGPDAASQDCLDERDQLLPQRREEAPDLGALGPRLILVEQRVISGRTVAQALGLALLQMDDLLEPRAKPWEVVRLAGGDPFL